MRCTLQIALPLFAVFAALLSIINLTAARPASTKRDNPSDSATPPPLKFGKKKSDFLVDGKNIPGLDFHIPDSYAGLLPAAEDGSKGIFFWYFPGEGTIAQEDLTIWIQNGASCSGLQGALQEIGPFIIPYGQSKPVQNHNRFTKLSNLLIIDYPVGIGFSQGAPPNGSVVAAHDFYYFWTHFFDIFTNLQTKTIYWSGEGEAANAVSYIMYELFSNQLMNLKFSVNYGGLSFISPIFFTDYFYQSSPSVDFAIRNHKTMGLDQKFINHLKDEAAKDNVTDILKNNLVYPSTGNFDSGSAPADAHFDPWGEIYNASVKANPCFTDSNILLTCPSKVDPLGFPPDAQIPSTDNWINNTPGFKKAIHVDESIMWAECSLPWGGNRDANDYAGMDGTTGGVIDYGTRNIIVSTEYDFGTIADGTALFLQFLPWNDGTGFQNPPTTPFLVDGHHIGTYTSERNLTYVRGVKTGHQLALEKPEWAFAIHQVLLGQKQIG